MNTDHLYGDLFRVYGDLDFRGKCPIESVEQITFFNRIRTQYPYTWGALAVHPRNEGLKRGGQFSAVSRIKAEGMTKGAADIIIPGPVSFVCELKRQDRIKSHWEDGQVEYLTAAAVSGAFSCIAFGADAAWQAFNEWLGAINAA